MAIQKLAKEKTENLTTVELINILNIKKITSKNGNFGQVMFEGKVNGEPSTIVANPSVKYMKQLGEYLQGDTDNFAGFTFETGFIRKDTGVKTDAETGEEKTWTNYKVNIDFELGKRGMIDFIPKYKNFSQFD